MKKIVYYLFFILNTYSPYICAAEKEGFEDHPLRWRFSPRPPVPDDPYGRKIVEFTGGARYVEVSTSGFKTLSRGPLPSNTVLGGSGRGCVSYSSLSEVWSKWPKGTIGNQSIFSYLLDSKRGETFSDFVRKWYKSSCAIVYYSGSGENKLIGTGAYIEGRSWVGFKRDEGIVATARHNFEGVPLSCLYARFFDYSVVSDERYPGWLHVCESFIDVPVIGTQTTQGGLDAGLLRLLPIPRNYREQYTRMISPSIERYEYAGITIPEGKYAMFHFAGTRHLVSVGHVYPPPMGGWLHSDVRIEAGPGASGAAILQQVGEHVSSEGISIYRHMDDFGTGRSVQRRIITYALFGKRGILNDRVTAPYRDNPRFRVIPPLVLEEDGYEFLRWRTEKHVARRTGMDARGRAISLFNHPDHPAYDLDKPDKMSNHHIIPIDHLLYLWEYVFDDRLDESTQKRIKDEVKREFERINRKRVIREEFQKRIRKEKIRRYIKLHRGLDSTIEDSIEIRVRLNLVGYSKARIKKKIEEEINNEIIRQAGNLPEIIVDEIWDETNRDYSESFWRNSIKLEIDRRVIIEIDHRYRGLKDLLESLSPEKIRDQTWFAWSWWNLFKGPKASYRDDDPSKDGTYDFSEKRRPLGFNEDLWNAVKNLDSVVKNLIRVSKNVRSTEGEIILYETEVRKSLEGLLRYWSEVIDKMVHPYNTDEWVKTGKSAGRARTKHPLYQLKRR